MAIGSGSIAFVGINTAGGPDDWIAFAALEAIPAGTVIYLSDNELAASNSTQFNTGESYTKWTAPAGGVAAGMVIKLTFFDATSTSPISGNTGPVASIGTASSVTFSGSANRGLSTTADSVYAYLANSDTTADTSITHLARINISGSTEDGVAPAALAANQKISFTGGQDSAVYVGAHSGQANFSDYLALINNPANWSVTTGATASASLNASNFTTVAPTPVLDSILPVVASQAEGNTGGTTNFDFTVTLSAAATTDTLVNLALTGDTSDFSTIPTSVTVLAGSTTATATFAVNADTTVEPDEIFTVTANLNGVNKQATATILNDDSAPLPTLSISDPTVTEGNAGTTILTYTVTASAAAPAGGITFDIATTDGTATAGTDYVAKNLPGQTIAAGNTTFTFDVVVNGDTVVEPNETVLVNLSNPVNATLADAQGSGTITNDDVAPPAANPWINEFHYDNASTDTNEFIEIAGAAGTDLSGYSLVLYNGGTTPAQATAAVVYDTKVLSGIIADQGNGYGTITIPAVGLQNGSPDAIALVGPNGVVQFLSYEGVVTASGGPATGMTSTDIGVSEPGTTAVGQSLQLTGTGTQYSDFTWHVEQAQTSGAVNTGQTFGTPISSVSIGDLSIAEGNNGTKLLTFTVTRSINSASFTVDFSTANGTATADSDYGASNGTLTFIAGGALTQQVSITINGDTTPEPNETFTVNLGNLVNTVGTTTIADGSATGTILNDDIAITHIYDIQGTGHTSAYAGQNVTTQGVVTAVASNGFYIQDVTGDGNAATSDGIFVFTSSAPSVTVGNLVNVAGAVQEFTPSGAAAGSFSTTEISGNPTITLLSTGNALPNAVTIGAGGVTPPTSDLNAGATFFEAMEGMRVTVSAPKATSPTNSFGEIFTVADTASNATGLNGRGDLLITGGATSFGNTDTVGGDFNPERVQIDDGLGFATPNVNVGAQLNDVTGVVGYSFGNYEVLATAPVTVATPSTLVKTGTTLTGDVNHLLIGSYNTENLDPNDGAARFTTVANEIITKLNTPDIVALQEIQDNNGAVGGTGSNVTSATQTLQMIVDAINAAGGPQYAFIDNTFIGANTNGGEPGGNIRTAYFYRTDHVSLVPGSLRTIAADGSALTSTDTSQQTDPNNPFFGSRPPLAADFVFNGQIVTVINDHFTSKGGSGALLGSTQPPLDGGEVQRAAQAQAVNNFIDNLLASNPNARFIVTGDLNDFDFEQPLSVLKGTASISNYTSNGADPFNATATYTAGGTAVLNDLQDLLPADQRFDYVFDGNAQTLDHMLASNSLTANAQFEPVHINSEFFDQTSDHDPLVGLFNIPATIPTVTITALDANSAEVGQDPGVFRITRTDDTSGALTVNYTIDTGAGQATSTDYTPALTGTVTIPAGQAFVDITVTPVDDTTIEGNENLTLTLSDTTNYDLGTTSTATVAIADNDAKVDLSTYVRVGRFDLPEPTRTAPPANSLLAQEVSAVTYDKDTDTLFVLGDGGTSIVQISKTGQLIDSMTLAPGGSPQGTEFYDPEGLTYVGNGKFVMTEERDRQVVMFDYHAGTTLTRADAKTVDLGTFVPNIGLEGVSYDPQTGGFILVKEKGPEGVFQTDIDFNAGTATNGSATTENSVNLFDPSLANLLDFADVFALSNLTYLNGQADTSHLLILSQESGKIINVDRSGHIYSSLTIHSDPGNPLDVVAQQHEGVTMDNNGYLYVVSENGGGDFDHPQLWVYAPSTVPNQAPTALALTNQTNAILENTSTTVRVKVADVAITDDQLGNNILTLTGADASFFEVDDTGLYIKAGTMLDFETKTNYSVTVNVDDPMLGNNPDASANFNLAVTDIVNENPAQATLSISEVAPWSSGNSPIAADWFEVTNNGSSAINISGWKMDDNSNSFASAVALNGITSIAAGESVIFIETTDIAGKSTAFLSNWFGANAPVGLQIGSYSGSGVGLSTGGDAVNLYSSTGLLQANVAFGVSDSTSPFQTFNNAAGLNNTAISDLSAVGVNGAVVATNDAGEIGSPGTVGKLFISEVAPWSSGNSPVAADWFEVTNTSTSAINISGWKMDDNSGSPAAAVALNGITSIAAGESVIFIETANLTAAKAAFLNTWFGSNAPAGLQIGSYTGSGVGLSTSGDEVNLYNSSNVLQARVAFGASPAGPSFPTFDSASSLNNTTISNLSVVGVNDAFNAVSDTKEIGSPGAITAVNHAPVAVDDVLSSIPENTTSRVISFASLIGNDSKGPANENGQSLTITNVNNAVCGTVNIVGNDVIFTPTANYFGPASFDYTVQDNGVSYGANNFLSDVGSVSFDITQVKHHPHLI